MKSQPAFSENLRHERRIGSRFTEPFLNPDGDLSEGHVQQEDKGPQNKTKYDVSSGPPTPPRMLYDEMKRSPFEAQNGGCDQKPVRHNVTNRTLGKCRACL